MIDFFVGYVINLIVKLTGIIVKTNAPVVFHILLVKIISKRKNVNSVIENFLETNVIISIRTLQLNEGRKQHAKWSFFNKCLSRKA